MIFFKNIEGSIALTAVQAASAHQSAAQLKAETQLLTPRLMGTPSHLSWKWLSGEAGRLLVCSIIASGPRDVKEMPGRSGILPSSLSNKANIMTHAGVSLGIWNELPWGFSVLAPMEDVTDTVFRRIVRAAGPPDLLMTEFTSSDGLCSGARAKVVGRLR